MYVRRKNEVKRCYEYLIAFKEGLFWVDNHIKQYNKEQVDFMLKILKKYQPETYNLLEVIK